MRRFRFSLDRVLKVKQQREKLAEVRVAQALAAAELARQAVAGVRQEIVTASLAMQQRVGRVLTGDVWAAAFDHSDRLNAALVRAEAVLREAETRLEEAVQARRQIATEVEALKTLRQQQWEQHRDEVQKAEQERLDEIGLRGWQENTRG